ncbi:MAG TPA: DNA repair protein RecN [Ktedonobacterales bacterium]|jgi:DNA repair protein RecN (Recombination protein N)
MLIELAISNFAIIDQLRLRPGPGFNVFTGETGAGKSIMIDAVAALLGERVGSDEVRSGADRALVEGIFDVSDLLPDADGTPATDAEDRDVPSPSVGDDADGSLVAALAEVGIEAEDGTLILAREIARGGRGTARVNGRAVPISVLQRLAAHLIDIHGQAGHLALLRPERHVYYLDRFAGADGLRDELGERVAEWRATRRALDALRRDERELERRAELLRFQVEEIEAARLLPDEQETLERERRVLANAERLGELCDTLHTELAGAESGDEAGALDLLAGARRTLAEVARLDPTLEEQAAALDEAIFRLEDVVSAVRTYQDEVAADPNRLAAIEERLDLIARLRRKYGATIGEILAFGAAAAVELEGLTNREERAAALQERDERLRREIGAFGTRLSHLRQRAAVALAAAMERELDELHMKRARFRVEISQRPDPEGVPAHPGLDGASDAPRPRAADGASAGAAPVDRAGALAADAARYAFGSTGIDHVEFQIAPNPGEPFKPLARIASGGETSRLMLAIKSILSAADAVPILIFDEIDAGISGRAGQVVGEKLWRLARRHQVICVTHLPQIAALADDHFRISKALAGGRTTTHVEPLAGSARVAELGELLGGADTRASRAAAADLLRRADEWKAGDVALAPA